MFSRSRVLVCFAALGAASSLALTGCASNSDSGGSSGAALPTISADSSAAALVPAAEKSKGTLEIGVDATYAPNEYKDSNDKIVGFDIDLFNGVVAKLGLKAHYVAASFDNILPGITGGKYDVGVSSFTDNKEREKTVDFVTYYNVGIQFAGGKGKDFNPDDACGKKVSVQAATIELDDLNARSKACTTAGKPAINIQQFKDQGDATTAVVLGKVDGMSADYPITVDAVNHNPDKIELVGPTNKDAAPYGYAVNKGSALSKALQAAVQSMIDDGSYDEICKHWKLEGGEIKTAQINGALS